MNKESIVSNTPAKNLITLGNVRDVLDLTYQTYDKCWNTLIKFEGFKLNQEFYLELMNFQPILCMGILKLEKLFHSISQEKRKLILRKQSLSIKWFTRRMKNLSDFQNAIEQCIWIGKSLGDAFVWIFYENEKTLLAEHRKHKEIVHLPVGIGGIGELAFITQIKKLGDCLIIYHGITTILRHGDISLFDLKQKKIVAIGDLKSEEASDGIAKVRFVCAGLSPNDVDKINRSFQNTSTEFANSTKDNDLLAGLPRPIREHLIHQLNLISSALKNREQGTYFKSTRVVKDHIDEFNRLYSKLKTNKFVYLAATPSQLLLAYKYRKQSFSSKLLGKSRINFPAKLKKIESGISSIIDPSLTNNLLYYDMFYYTKKGTVLSLPGTVPLFWWPVDKEFLRKIIFQEVFVFIFFNPRHFLIKLEANGFTVEHDKGKDIFKVSKDINGVIHVMNPFNHYFELIMKKLVSEDAVIDMLNDVYRTVGEHDLPHDRSYIISLDFEQSFSMPNDIETLKSINPK